MWWRGTERTLRVPPREGAGPGRVQWRPARRHRSGQRRRVCERRGGRPDPPRGAWPRCGRRMRTRSAAWAVNAQGAAEVAAALAERRQATGADPLLLIVSSAEVYRPCQRPAASGDRPGGAGEPLCGEQAGRGAGGVADVAEHRACAWWSHGRSRISGAGRRRTSGSRGAAGRCSKPSGAGRRPSRWATSIRCAIFCTWTTWWMRTWGSWRTAGRARSTTSRPVAR